MSLEPIASGALTPDLAAVIAHELAMLAADAQTLQTRLTTGDVVAAIVLPSNGLTDLVDIGGLRVAAELPPTLLPGDTITVEVTGFTGDRINLQILSTEANVPSPSPVLPRATTPAVAAPAIDGASRPATDGASRPASAPVPARTQRVVERPAPVAAPPLRPAVVAAARRAPVAPNAAGNIEARLATARAASAGTPPPAAAASAGARPASAGGHQPQRPAMPAVPRPLIAARAPVAVLPAAAATKAVLAAPTQAVAREAPRPPASVAGAPAAPPPAPVRGPAAYAEPAALLRALHLPVTATNVTAARLALDAPERLPQALQVLERALTARTDPHVATLRTLVAFIGRLEPRSPVLATQIAAFVDQVVSGRETKLAQLLEAHVAAASTPAGSTATSVASAAERVALRQAALDYDLKTNMLALVKGGREAMPAAPAELIAAVGKAVAAVTALQIGAAATLAANPEGLAFSLPIALPTGFARAHVRVDRDAPQTTAALDGDNFHIAFVLETQHLGTVAIDVMTVGRCVTLRVATEGLPAQRAFGAALSELTRRLESLRYRVAGADTVIAPRAAAPPPAQPAVRGPSATDRSRLVDLDA